MATQEGDGRVPGLQRAKEGLTSLEKSRRFVSACVCVCLL